MMLCRNLDAVIEYNANIALLNCVFDLVWRQHLNAAHVFR